MIKLLVLAAVITAHTYSFGNDASELHEMSPNAVKKNLSELSPSTNPIPSALPKQEKGANGKAITPTESYVVTQAKIMGKYELSPEEEEFFKKWWSSCYYDSSKLKKHYAIILDEASFAEVPLNFDTINGIMRRQIATQNKLKPFYEKFTTLMDALNKTVTYYRIKKVKNSIQLIKHQHFLFRIATKRWTDSSGRRVFQLRKWLALNETTTPSILDIFEMQLLHLGEQDSNLKYYCMTKQEYNKLKNSQGCFKEFLERPEILHYAQTAFWNLYCICRNSTQTVELSAKNARLYRSQFANDISEYHLYLSQLLEHLGVQHKKLIKILQGHSPLDTKI